MRVIVIGLGYIGLPTAAILASRGISVLGVDCNQSVVETVNQGQIHIVESGLDSLVETAVDSGYLRATVTPERGDVFMIAVPTPFKGTHEPDLSYIESAAKAIAPVLQKGNMVILESTVPVGATEKLMQWLQLDRPDLVFPVSDEKGGAVDITIGHCPERVLPGHVVRELVENDRVIGGITKQCAERIQGFYKIFVQGDCLLTNCRTAELCKLVENSFRDVNIAFANELSLIADKFDVNVWELIKLANHHPRVNILQPGPGVGGHCIAVDPWFIVDSAPNESKLIHVARLVNDSKPDFVLEKIEQAALNIGKEKASLSIACLGLAFKPNIDDLRESPAMKIAKRIEGLGFSKQYLVEPNINAIPEVFDVKSTELINLEAAMAKVDIVVLLVDHTAFKEMDLSLLSGKQVVDTRGLFDNYN
jgi:UDP-N-acetyl-D-mannosaminuronic acid dehydrogenase